MAEIDSNNIYSQLGLTRANDKNDKPNDELGQAEFLKLMTTQLRFQDPLEPMENGDFLAQMAQFGTVSGVNELNESFDSMSAAFQSNQALQASTLVGRKVLVPANQANLTQDDGLQAAINLDRPANNVIVNITDSAGQLVHREELGLQQAGLSNFTWNGQLADGSQAAQGLYQISAEVHRGDQVSSGETLSVVDVESVTLGQAGQDLTLSVSGLGDISLSQVRKIM